MMVVQKQFATLLLLVSLAGAQTAGVASLQDVQVTHAGNDVRIEITLDAPVKASVITAVHPDRLVLELPNTTISEQQHIPVYFDGVRVVRYALHQISPAVTRVVVELDQAQPYALETNGTHIILTISPELDARANAHRSGAPAAAASGGFIGVFRRKQDSLPPAPANENAQIPAAPPSGPPLRFPSDKSSNGATNTASTSQPSAAHPSLGSLQQGTVFPGTGTPGAGTVPPATSGAPGSFDSATAAQAAAKKTAPIGPAFPATAAAKPAAVPTQSLPQGSSRSVAGNQPGSTAASVPPSPPISHPLGSAGQAAAVRAIDAIVQPPPPVQAAVALPPAPSSPLPVTPASSPTVEVRPGNVTASASQVPPPTPPEPAGQTVATYAAAVANLKPVPVETTEPDAAGERQKRRPPSLQHRRSLLTTQPSPTSSRSPNMPKRQSRARPTWRWKRCAPRIQICAPSSK